MEMGKQKAKKEQIIKRVFFFWVAKEQIELEELIKIKKWLFYVGKQARSPGPSITEERSWV